MKAILTLLLLALASLAIPSSSAALPVACSLGPMTPGGDTHCEGEVAKCDVLVHAYDKEDALNHYKADCGCVAYDNYGRPDFRFDCYTPPPIASGTPAAAAAPELPIATHCWSAEFGSGCSTTVTTAVAICTYSSFTTNEGQSWSDLACSNNDLGSCSIGLTPVQNPPNVWCEDYGPPQDTSASSAQAAQPCQTGFGSSWCTVTAGPCRATVYTYMASGARSANGRCDTDAADCTFAAGGNVVTTTAVGAAADCVSGPVHCHTDHGVGQVLLPPGTPNTYCTHDDYGQSTATAAAEFPPDPCIEGMAQTWCDFTVGPCDIRVVPWTAWGDRYLVSDCHLGGGAGATCHTEIHTEGPLAHQHSCAW